MMSTIALIIIPSAIVLIFAQDIARLIKKVFAIPGVKLFFPLIFFSYIVDSYQQWEHYYLSYLHVVVHNSLIGMAGLLPFHQTIFIDVMSIAFLWCVLFSPVGLAFFYTKYKRLPGFSTVPYYYSIALGIIAAFLIMLTY